MDSPSNMTRAEKEQYVIELLKKNKGSRVIAERAHMSFSDIGRIRKKMEKEIELEKRRLEGKGGNNSKSSKRTQAIKMFSEGKDATDIVIGLDLPPERIRSILREYLEVRNMYDVLQVYEQIKDHRRYSFPSFLRLYMTANSLEMGEEQINKVLELAKHNQLEHLQWKVEYLSNEVTKSTNDILRLTKIKDELIADVSYLNNTKEELTCFNRKLMPVYDSAGDYNRFPDDPENELP